jgi:hypothetical protein
MVTIVLDTSSLTTAQDTNIRGLREFLPDFGKLVKQVLPFQSVPIPRASTAMMLGAFFSTALRVTKDVPGYEAVRAEIAAYVTAHAEDWLGKSELWFDEATGCEAKYFPNHLAFASAYAWATLEEDTLRRSRVVNAVLDTRLWSALSEHKNSYFAYLWAGTRPSTPDAATVAIATTQLGQFMHAPKGWPAIDHLADYAHDADCMIGGYATSQEAVDVAHRNMDDFIWQRGAWILKSAGNPSQLFPATDYLAAYWVARHHALIADDRVGTCARWAP